MSVSPIPNSGSRAFPGAHWTGVSPVSCSVSQKALPGPA